MSKLSIGIVGLPNVGKSTLFNILTKQSVSSANYPFATIDPNVGVVSVPDERVDKLAELSSSKEKIPAVVEFYDIAGLVRGANKGEGLGNKFLSHIKEADAILHLVRVFRDEDVAHIEGTVDPLRDIDTIEDELVLKDLEVIEGNFKKVEGEARAGSKEAKKRYEILVKIKDVLESAEPLASSKIGSDEDVLEISRELNLLTIKKQLFLLNGNESEVSGGLEEKIENMKFDYVVSDLGDKSVVPDVIRKAYETLGLISFFTTGEKETRAWTTRQGATAPEAAGVIHSDFEESFIRAEVISYPKLIEVGGWIEARRKGDIRVEGKEYVVKDGDVVYFRTGK